MIYRNYTIHTINSKLYVSLKQSGLMFVRSLQEAHNLIDYIID